MAQKPEIVNQYEARKKAGEPLYFDPVELDDIFHYYAEENMVELLPEVMNLAKELHPNDIVTRMMQAEYALNMGEATDCLQLLEQVFDEANPFHCILRSGALAKLGKVTEAIDYAERAMRGDDPLIGYDLGLGFMNAGQSSLALRYYGRCLDSYPDDLRTILGILYCMNMDGSAEEIIQYADRALEVDSFCTEAWMAKGGALAEQEKWQEAEECYDYVLAIMPDSADAMMMKANCCVQQDRFDEGLQVSLDAAEKADTEQRANIYLLIARLMNDQKQHDEAVEYAWKAVQTNPMDDDLVERAALAFADFDEYRTAILLAEDVVAKNGKTDNLYLLNMLAEQYSKMNEYQKALPYYERVAELKPDATSYSLLAGTYMSINKFRKAYHYLQKANETEPMWQTYVLMAVCANELKWNTARQDCYTMAYCIDAEQSEKLLSALSEEAVAHFEVCGVFAAAEKWRNEHMNEELKKLIAENRR